MRDLFIIVGCWAISFLFNGIEAGLTSIDPVRLRHHVKLNRPAAVRLDRLLKTPERLLVTVLLVTNLADILALLLLTRLLVFRFGTAGFAFTIVIALPIYLFVLGVLPKSLLRRFPFRALSPLARLLEISMRTLWPVLAAGAALGRLFLPAQQRGARLFAAREELKQITTQSEREGSLTATERAMIHNVVDFGGVKAHEVMVPLNKVIAVQPDASVEEAIKLSASSGLDRLPVITPEGQPKGLINILDVLLEKNGGEPVSQYMRRVVMANEDEPAYRIVQRLRAARLGLAAVLDRQRNLRGIVTIEDLVRRLVSSTEARA